MKAVVLTEFGSASNLELQERDVPDIGPERPTCQGLRDLGQPGGCGPA